MPLKAIKDTVIVELVPPTQVGVIYLPERMIDRAKKGECNVPGRHARILSIGDQVKDATLGVGDEVIADPYSGKQFPKKYWNTPYNEVWVYKSKEIFLTLKCQDHA